MKKYAIKSAAISLLPSRYWNFKKFPFVVMIVIVALGAGSMFIRKSQAASCSGVAVSPGANIQGLIDANGTGATFCFNAGTYTITTALKPKTGNKFIAITPRTAILSGNNAKIMAINNQSASNVEINGMVIEKFLTTRQGGISAVKGGHYWLLDNNEFRYNNSDVYLESNGTMINGYHHHSWAVGGGGYKGTNFRFENNEVAHMNPNNYNDAVTKWTAVNGLVIRGNYVHSNQGSGLWVDGDNINVVIENNRVENNTLDGIHYEISCSGVVRNNIISNNGRHGIALVASQNVEVFDNHVTGSKQGAIVVWHQNRGSGTNCQWTVDNNQIHNNVMQNDEGYMGVRVYQAVDGNEIYTKGDPRVKFYSNTYYNNISHPFYWMNTIQTKETWQGSYGQDLDSTFLSGQAPPPSGLTGRLGDVNGDSVVNGLDLSKVLTNYGNNLSGALNGDLNSDATVNALDLSQVLTNYGKTYSLSELLWSGEFGAPLGMTT